MVFSLSSDIAQRQYLSEHDRMRRPWSRVKHHHIRSELMTDDCIDEDGDKVNVSQGIISALQS